MDKNYTDINLGICSGENNENSTHSLHQDLLLRVKSFKREGWGWGWQRGGIIHPLRYLRYQLSSAEGRGFFLKIFLKL